MLIHTEYQVNRIKTKTAADKNEMSSHPSLKLFSFPAKCSAKNQNMLTL